MIELPLLSSLIALPALAAFFLLFMGLITNRLPLACFGVFGKYFCFIVSLIELGLIIKLLMTFDNNLWMQFIESYSWIKFGNFSLDLLLGVDGISLLFIVLTGVSIPLCLLASWKVSEKPALYFSLFLIAESLIIGFFSSLNLLIFYLFFEAVLIPLLIIIGIWGGKGRIFASYKFLLYTFLGSLLLLVAIISISLEPCNPLVNANGDFCRYGTGNFLVMGGFLEEQIWQGKAWIWWFFFIGLAVKIPLWPLHTWLPYAHVQAPTGGSMILAGLLLKMGGYGIIRLLLDAFPRLSTLYSDYVIILSIIALLYGSLVALVQTNMKKMIAYSSVAHMGYVTAGLFAGTPLGVFAGIYQMISHGIISPALFFIVGLLYDRTHTKKISYYGGVAKKMPNLAIFFMIALLGSIGLPGTSGFIGEFTSIVASLEKNLFYGVALALGTVLGALYMLKLFANLMLNKSNKNTRKLKDLTKREIIILTFFSFFILLLGLYPRLIMVYLERPLDYLVQFYSEQKHF
jgi:NADH-quinone oxidoreductase subunit M